MHLSKNFYNIRFNQIRSFKNQKNNFIGPNCNFILRRDISLDPKLPRCLTAYSTTNCTPNPTPQNPSLLPKTPYVLHRDIQRLYSLVLLLIREDSIIDTRQAAPVSRSYLLSSGIKLQGKKELSFFQTFYSQGHFRLIMILLAIQEFITKSASASCRTHAKCQNGISPSYTSQPTK